MVHEFNLPPLTKSSGLAWQCQEARPFRNTPAHTLGSSPEPVIWKDLPTGPGLGPILAGSAGAGLSPRDREPLQGRNLIIIFISIS